MAQGDVDMAYRAYDAVNRRDLDAYLAVMDDDVEAVARLAAMEGEYHGHEGIRRWWDSTLDAFPDLSLEVVEVRDLGGVMVAAVHVRGHGADSHAPVDETVWTAIEYRDGKATWWRVFDSRDEAVEASGPRGS